MSMALHGHGRIVSQRFICDKGDVGDFGVDVHWPLDASDPAAIGFTDDKKPRKKERRVEDKTERVGWRDGGRFDEKNDRTSIRVGRKGGSKK